MSTTLLWLETNIINRYQNALLSVGIDSAFKAGVAAAVITAGVLWVMKPSSVFDEETGQPRPWVLLNEEEGGKSSGIEPAILPWYARAALVGYVVNLTA